MEFSWSKEQLALKSELASFGRAELNDGLAERDVCGGFNRTGWQRCAEVGVLGLPVAKPYGSERDLPTVVLALEGLGYGCEDNGLLFAMGAQMWSVQMPIQNFGTAAQKDVYLAGMVSGRIIGAHCVTEPGNGSDAFSLRTTAIRDGDDYILDGAKTFTSNAPEADAFLVMATVDRAKGPGGLTAFLIDKGTPGLTVTRHLEKMGVRTSPMGELSLASCRVKSCQVLGPVGGGTSVFNAAMDWERSFLLAPHLGTMQRQIDRCVRFVNRRGDDGKPGIKDDAHAMKIVDMQVRLETARLLTYRTAWMRSAGKRLTREPSETKLVVSETWVHNSDDALQIFGAAGYLDDPSIERDLRDARASKIYSGTSEIQRLIVSRWLGV
jgi:alkylation response protein AidB-like acyl-CoA dehydrogenase